MVASGVVVLVLCGSGCGCGGQLSSILDEFVSPNIREVRTWKAVMKSCCGELRRTIC